MIYSWKYKKKYFLLSKSNARKWRTKILNDVLFWTPTRERANVGWSSGTYIRYVLTPDAIQQTFKKQWMIKMNGESVKLSVRVDDDDDDGKVHVTLRTVSKVNLVTLVKGDPKGSLFNSYYTEV